MSADCRVRKLHIRTQDEELLPRISFVIEDALRTASFPGIPPNGMVYIRRLDLGKNVVSVSSRVLAQRIDDLLRLIRPVHITENAIDYVTAPAVWFADELEPYRLLISLLSRNQRPLSWYWPVAVKGWTQKLSIKQSYQLVMSSVSQHAAGIRGMYHVLGPLFNTRTILDVLAMFEPKEVSRWISHLGLNVKLDLKVVQKKDEKTHDNIGIYKKSLPLEVFCDWGEAIRTAVKNWSIFDSRTLFTSYLALANIGQVPTSFQVMRLFDAVSKQQNDGRSLSSQEQRQYQPEQVKRYLVHDSGGKGDTSRLSNEPFEKLSQPTPKEHVKFSGNENVQKVVFLDAEGKGRELHKKKDLSEPPLQEFPWPENRPLFGGFAGELSRYAGLVFLVPVMKRLGIETLFATYPDYFELQFAERIIWRVAELLRIPGDDPVLHFLGAKPDVSRQIEFVAPAHWRVILTSPGREELTLRLCRIAGIPGQRLIMDDQGRLVIGLWNTKNRDLVIHWLHSAKLRLCPLESGMWSVEKAIDNFVLAMCCYIRRYGKMNLHALVQRPAYMATTRTHLDVTIPFDHLDIRIRMAGLDINPGWVAWLGRVIQFHYVGGES